MWPLSIIQIEVTTDASARVRDRVVGMKIPFFVFDRSPQSLNEYIVTPGAFAVHADADAMVLEQVGECPRSI